jgi:hypothetical protein
MNTRRFHHISKELKKQGEDPDYHPLIRALFKDAAAAIEELTGDLEALIREGDDHD